LDQQSEHLSNAQIEQYGNQYPGAEQNAGQPDADQRIDKHLSDCGSCRSRVLDFERTRLGVMTDPNVNKAPTSACPSEEDLRTLAAGLCSEPVAAKLTQHATQCDRCGPLLREYAEDFSEELSSEDSAVLEKLGSSSEKWQNRVARAMRKAGSSSEYDKFGPASARQKVMIWKWALAASLAIIVVVGSLWFYPRWEVQQGTEAIASEYRRGRPMAYRVAGVPYGPVRVERGGAGLASAIEVPPPQRSPLLAANAQLLQRDSNAAKSILEDAIHRGNNSLLILNDLVVAYAMEADRTRSNDDYIRALAIADQVLSKDISDPTALFNRALVLERLGRRDEAITALEHLLTIENDPAWKKEAANELRLLQ